MAGKFFKCEVEMRYSNGIKRLKAEGYENFGRFIDLLLLMTEQSSSNQKNDLFIFRKDSLRNELVFRRTEHLISWLKLVHDCFTDLSEPFQYIVTNNSVEVKFSKFSEFIWNFSQDGDRDKEEDKDKYGDSKSPILTPPTYSPIYKKKKREYESKIVQKIMSSLSVDDLKKTSFDGSKFVGIDELIVDGEKVTDLLVKEFGVDLMRKEVPKMKEHIIKKGLKDCGLSYYVRWLDRTYRDSLS